MSWYWYLSLNLRFTKSLCNCRWSTLFCHINTWISEPNTHIYAFQIYFYTVLNNCICSSIKISTWSSMTMFLHTKQGSWRHDVIKGEAKKLKNPMNTTEMNCKANQTTRSSQWTSLPDLSNVLVAKPATNSYSNTPKSGRN